MTRLAAVAAFSLVAGCGTTRTTDTARTATEQLLVSNAVDTAVAQLDLSALAGRDVYLNADAVKGAVDSEYLVSTLRQHLLANGAVLRERREEATFVVEARTGCVGTDKFSLMVGVPQMNIPIAVPGYPTSIPEIALAKKTDQYGLVKLAVFAYNRKTGRALWQSGVVRGSSNTKDTWLLGAGPFRRGSSEKGTKLGDIEIPLPTIQFTGAAGDAPPVEGVEPTRAYQWQPAGGQPGKGPTRLVTVPETLGPSAGGGGKPMAVRPAKFEGDGEPAGD